MSQQQPEQEIIESCIPEIRDFYRSHPDLFFWATPLDRNYKYWKENIQDRPITHRIDQLIRFKSGDDNEKLYYYETMIAKDAGGNDLNFDWVQGRVEVPVAHREWIQDSGAYEDTYIERHDTVYNIPN